MKRIIGLDEAKSNFFKELKEGDEYIDKGFVSTTIDPKYEKFIESAYRFSGGVIKLTILADKGTKSIPVDSLDSEINQSELLLNRNSKFKVIERIGNELTVKLI